MIIAMNLIPSRANRSGKAAVRHGCPDRNWSGQWSGFLINHLSGDYYLDGSSREVDRLTLTRSIYDETYGQWNGTSFTAPTEGLYEFTIRMVGISSDTTGPPIIIPQLNGFLIDKWHCKIYGNADCQKTFQGKKIQSDKIPIGLFQSNLIKFYVSVHMKLNDVLVFKFDYEISTEPPFKIDQFCLTRGNGQNRLDSIGHSCNTITGQLIKLVQT